MIWANEFFGEVSFNEYLHAFELMSEVNHTHMNIDMRNTEEVV